VAKLLAVLPKKTNRPSLDSKGELLGPLACTPRAPTLTRLRVWQLIRTLLGADLRVQGRTVWYETVAEMQATLEAFLLRYNRERPHQGRGMNGRTPLQAFVEGLPVRPEPQQENRPQPIAA
jgi:transposase InsO family protein